MKTIINISTTLILLTSCGMYSFNGASISSETKSVQIDYFSNSSSMGKASLSDDIVEGLKDKFSNETNLTIINSDGDLFFKGSITSYSVKPIAIQADETAAKNRLTISVKVCFENKLDLDNNYDQSFSRYADYYSTTELSSIEDELVNQIIAELIDDIFNKAVANW